MILFRLAALIIFGDVLPGCVTLVNKVVCFRGVPALGVDYLRVGVNTQGDVTNTQDWQYLQTVGISYGGCFPAFTVQTTPMNRMTD